MSLFLPFLAIEGFPDQKEEKEQEEQEGDLQEFRLRVRGWQDQEEED